MALLRSRRFQAAAAALAAVALVIGLVLTHAFGPSRTTQNGSAGTSSAPALQYGTSGYTHYTVSAGCTIDTIRDLSNEFGAIVDALGSAGYEFARNGEPTIGYYPDARACDYIATLMSYHTGQTITIINNEIQWTGTLSMTCLPSDSRLSVGSAVMKAFTVAVATNQTIVKWTSASLAAPVSVRSGALTYRVTCNR